MTLAEAAAQADALAGEGSERELAELRSKWGDELEGAARSDDYRERAVAYRAIGQFRFRQKQELIGRGLEDEAPACRGYALVSLELLSRDGPAPVNAFRSRLHQLATNDPIPAVRRLAIVTLRNGSAQRDTIALLAGLSEDDRVEADVRTAAARTSAQLKRKSNVR